MTRQFVSALESRDPQRLASYLAMRTNEAECQRCTDVVQRILRNQRLAESVHGRLMAIRSEGSFDARADLEIADAVGVWLFDGPHQAEVSGFVKAMIFGTAVFGAIRRGDGISLATSALQLANVAKSFDIEGLAALNAFSSWAFHSSESPGIKTVSALLSQSCLITWASAGALVVFNSVLAEYGRSEAVSRTRFLDHREALAWAEHFNENEEVVLLQLRLRRGARRLSTVNASVDQGT